MAYYVNGERMPNALSTGENGTWLPSEPFSKVSIWENFETLISSELSFLRNRFTSGIDNSVMNIVDTNFVIADDTKTVASTHPKFNKMRGSRLPAQIQMQTKHILPDNIEVVSNFNAANDKAGVPDFYVFDVKTSFSSPKAVDSASTNSTLSSNRVRTTLTECMASMHIRNYEIPQFLDEKAFFQALTGKADSFEDLYTLQITRQKFNYMVMHNVNVGFIATDSHIRFICRPHDSNLDSSGVKGGEIMFSKAFPKSIYGSTEQYQTSVFGYIIAVLSATIKGSELYSEHIPKGVHKILGKEIWSRHSSKINVSDNNFSSITKEKTKDEEEAEYDKIAAEKIAIATRRRAERKAAREANQPTLDSKRFFLTNKDASSPKVSMAEAITIKQVPIKCVTLVSKAAHHLPGEEGVIGDNFPNISELADMYVDPSEIPDAPDHEDENNEEESSNFSGTSYNSMISKNLSISSTGESVRNLTPSTTGDNSQSLGSRSSYQSVLSNYQDSIVTLQRPPTPQNSMGKADKFHTPNIDLHELDPSPSPLALDSPVLYSKEMNRLTNSSMESTEISNLSFASPDSTRLTMESDILSDKMRFSTSRASIRSGPSIVSARPWGSRSSSVIRRYTLTHNSSKIRNSSRIKRRHSLAREPTVIRCERALGLDPIKSVDLTAPFKWRNQFDDPYRTVGTFDLIPEKLTRLFPRKNFGNTGKVLSCKVTISNKPEDSGDDEWHEVCRSQTYSRNHGYVPGKLIVVFQEYTNTPATETYDVVVRRCEYSHTFKGIQYKEMMESEVNSYAYLDDVAKHEGIIPKFYAYGDVWGTHKMLVLSPWGRPLRPLDLTNEIVGRMHQCLDKLHSHNTLLRSFALEAFGIAPDGSIRLIDLRFIQIMNKVPEKSKRHEQELLRIMVSKYLTNSTDSEEHLPELLEHQRVRFSILDSLRCLKLKAKKIFGRA